MLWVLKRTVSKHMFKLMGKKMITILHSKMLLNWAYVQICLIMAQSLALQVPERIFSKKLILKKISRQQKSTLNFPGCNELR